MLNEARKKTKKNKSCNIICLDQKSLNWLPTAKSRLPLKTRTDPAVLQRGPTATHERRVNSPAHTYYDTKTEIMTFLVKIGTFKSDM